jgi:ABC-2 type transport system permease protein
MMKHIVAKEWKEIRRDKVSMLILISVVFLLTASILTSLSYNAWYNRQQQKLTADARRHWDTQGVKNSHSAAHHGIYLFKPLSPLGLWDNGIDKYNGVSLYIEAHKRNQLQFKAVEDNPAIARWGELTPSYVLLFLLPLLIIWLGSNSVVRERVSGTMKLALSQGISPVRYISGKALTLWLITAIIITGAWLLSGLLLSILRAENFFTGESFLLLLMYLLYGGIFIHISLWMSLSLRSHRAVILTLLGFWLISIFMVPKLTVQLSEHLYPVPLREDFQKAIDEDVAVHGLNGHGGESEKLKELEKQWLAKYGADSLQQLPVNWLGIILQADEDINNEIFEHHFDRLFDTYARQEKIHRWSGLLSPVMPVRHSSMNLSGTDLWSSIYFTGQADVYRKEFIRILNNRLRDNSRYNGRDTGTVAFWQTLPQFSYRAPSLETRWQHGKSGLLIVCLWFAGSGLLLYWGASRLKVV